MAHRKITLVLVLVLAVAASADTLKLKNGKVFQGRLVGKTESRITFEIHKYGTKVTMSFRPDEVASIEKGEPAAPKNDSPQVEKSATAAKEDKPREPAVGELPSPPEPPPIVEMSGDTYYVVPLNGTVGEKFLARMLRQALEDAVKREPTVVVLQIDSPGGLLSEVDKLLEVIREYDDRLRMVVYVKEALSAAAITALAVDEIYFEPAGIFGAATAYAMGALGPVAIEEKMQSVWRATARSAAETGGHSSLLAEAMIDRNMQLHVVQINGKQVVREGRGAVMVSKTGKLLTMTAKEALRAGLSSGSAENFAELGEVMGLEGWQEMKGFGVPLAAYWNTVIDKVDADLETLGEEYTDLMEKIADNYPWAYRGYQVWGNGPHAGMFTPRSQRIWKKRASVCTRLMLDAEKVVEKAKNMLDAVPEREDFREWLADREEQLREERVKLYRNINVRRPADIDI